MRRSRAKLTVSTFPFLAVLLCAMGSLIMLLMVFDQRAKRAARQRNLQAAVEVARQEEERWKKAQALMAEETAKSEAERQEQIRKTRLEGEQRLQELGSQAEEVNARDRNAGRDQAVEAEKIRKLREATLAAAKDRERTAGEMRALRAGLDQAQRERLEKEKQRAERKLATEQARRAVEAERKAETERLDRLNAELVGLEKVLKQAEEKKEKSAQTFSIVPYKGKRGEDKRPIYVECTWNKLIFHPDRFAVDPADSRMGLMVQIEDRARAQNQRYVAAGLPPHPRPFLMLLVRPDGIGTYYQFQVAMKGQAVDFGYELIDQDWELDFPQEGPETLPPDRNQLARNHPAPASDGVVGFGNGLSGPIRGGSAGQGIPAGERGLQPGGTLAPGLGGGLPGGVPGLLPGGLGTSGAGDGIGGARGFRSGIGSDEVNPGGQGLGGIANGPPAFPGTGNGSGARGIGTGSDGLGGGVNGLGGGGGTGANGTGMGSSGLGGGAGGSGVASGTGGPGGVGGNGPRMGAGGLVASGRGQGIPGGSGTGVDGGLAGLGTGNGAGMGAGTGAGVPGLPGAGAGGANPDGSIPGVMTTPQRIPGPTAPALGATGLTAPGSFGGLPGALPGMGEGGLGGMPGSTGASGPGGVGGLPGPGGVGGAAGTAGVPGGNGARSGVGEGSGGSAGTGMGSEGGAAGAEGAVAKSGPSGGGAAGNGAAGTPGALPPMDGPPPAPSVNLGSSGGAGSSSGGGISVNLNPQEKQEEPVPAKLPRPSGASGDGFATDDPALEALNRLNVPLPPVAEEKPRAPRPLKMARLTGGRELTQYVECTADGVVLHPGGKKFTRQMVSQPEQTNPLLQELKERVERRRTLDRAAGTTSFIQVRFLVWPDGMRAYHSLYPIVATWPVHSRQQTVNNAKDLREALSSQ